MDESLVGQWEPRRVCFAEVDEGVWGGCMSSSLFLCQIKLRVFSSYVEVSKKKNLVGVAKSTTMARIEAHWRGLLVWKMDQTMMKPILHKLIERCCVRRQV